MWCYVEKHWLVYFCSKQISSNRFLLYLVEQVVLCKLTPIQKTIYKTFISSKLIGQSLKEEKLSASSLAFINQIKKLCNRKKICYYVILLANNVSRQACSVYFKILNRIRRRLNRIIWIDCRNLFINMTHNTRVWSKRFHMLISTSAYFVFDGFSTHIHSLWFLWLNFLSIHWKCFCTKKLKGWKVSPFLQFVC